MGDRLGGHWVQGHVDGVGRIERREPDGPWLGMWFTCPADLAAQMVPKGSVAVDGVSLTLVDVQSGKFSVMLIPHTRDNTTLGIKEPGAAVNIEFDLIAKHVRKLVQNMTITI